MLGTLVIDPEKLSIKKLAVSNFWLLLLGSLAISVTFVVSLCLLFEPRWESNDDVAMSMVAHGYGIAAFGTPKIMFSNILWGQFVRAIPEIDGILGYSLATLGILVTVGALLFFGLRKFGTHYVTSLSILALVLVRPVLFPQFTINAGLLFIGAFICFHLYARCNDQRTLLFGYLLAFLVI